jgi:hypothetical protein
MKELSELPAERDQACPQLNLQPEVTGLLRQLLRALIRRVRLIWRNLRNGSTAAKFHIGELIFEPSGIKRGDLQVR